MTVEKQGLGREIAAAENKGTSIETAAAVAASQADAGVGGRDEGSAQDRGDSKGNLNSSSIEKTVSPSTAAAAAARPAAAAAAPAAAPAAVPAAGEGERTSGTAASVEGRSAAHGTSAATPPECTDGSLAITAERWAGGGGVGVGGRR